MSNTTTYQDFYRSLADGEYVLLRKLGEKLLILRHTSDPNALLHYVEERLPAVERELEERHER